MSQSVEPLQAKVTSLERENQSLKQELKILRQTHQFVQMELNESRENEAKLKKLNDTLIDNISTTQIPTKLEDININIEGQFLNKRIAELQRELDKYRNGVNSSIDRRVKEIVKEYSEFQEEENKKRSRIKCNCSKNININYNVKKIKNGSQNIDEERVDDGLSFSKTLKNIPDYEKQCQNCQYLKKIIREKDQLIQSLRIEIQELTADKDVYLIKFSKQQNAFCQVKKQNQRLLNELNQTINELNEQRNYIDQKQHEFAEIEKQYHNDYDNLHKKHEQLLQEIQEEEKYPSKLRKIKSSNKENEMIREIGNMVQCISNRKQNEMLKMNSSRLTTNSRISAVTMDYGSLFSIKDGINRPNAITYY